MRRKIFAAVFFLSFEVNFTKLFCKAKRRRRTELGKKFAFQFHQQSTPKLSSQNLRLKIRQICAPFAKKRSRIWHAKNLHENVDEIDPRSLFFLTQHPFLNDYLKDSCCCHSSIYNFDSFLMSLKMSKNYHPK